MSLTISRGDVVLVALDANAVGHEQRGRRPCIVVTRHELAAQQRYPVIVVVPVTGTTDLGGLYPIVQPYRGGFTKPSTVLIDMIRSVDKLRVQGRLAPLPREDLRRVDDALRGLLAL